jgi:signal transduction histidine kinase
MEGVDSDWRDSGARRETSYTNLRPRLYRFRVIACNQDGVWNETGAAFTFTILPTWYQTLWFECLCALAAGALLMAVYRFRLRKIAATMNARFDERLTERTRIARDFHDTLLQTIQGSKMVVDTALSNKFGNEEMLGTLERLSGWLDQAVREGRAALSSLRESTTEKNDLAEALRRACEECAFHRPIEFDVSVSGSGKEMHPIARDEVYRIGYEAIRNACNHSRGGRLTVELSYVDDLVLRIRDNGKGFDIATATQSGHYGLVGMQERAARIGGRLTISSSAESGTLVELLVPHNVVFHGQRPVSKLSRWRRLWKRISGVSS